MRTRNFLMEQGTFATPSHCATIVSKGEKILDLAHRQRTSKQVDRSVEDLGIVWLVSEWLGRLIGFSRIWGFSHHVRARGVGRMGLGSEVLKGRNHQTFTLRLLNHLSIEESLISQVKR